MAEDEAVEVFVPHNTDSNGLLQVVNCFEEGLRVAHLLQLLHALLHQDLEVLHFEMSQVPSRLSQSSRPSQSLSDLMRNMIIQTPYITRL